MEFEKAMSELCRSKTKIENYGVLGNYDAQYPGLTDEHDMLENALMNEQRGQLRKGVAGAQGRILAIVGEAEKHVESLNGPLVPRLRNVPR